jgi:hypothetical protein
MGGRRNASLPLLPMFKLNSIKSYLFYSYFQEAHFVAIDDRSPIIVTLFAITDDDGIVATLPYHDIYGKDFTNISFTQTSLFKANRFDDRIEAKDTEGVNRKIRFFKLHNMLTDNYKRFLMKEGETF